MILSAIHTIKKNFKLRFLDSLRRIQRHNYGIVSSGLKFKYFLIKKITKHFVTSTNKQLKIQKKIIVRFCNNISRQINT